ncbi:phytoene desaturase family protein [Catalinimonas niigatensis]|uniref:phytoene desaturase family protein n=1 Tax=Catalinimonas niigatensis TaxID=1397264 RepID=UPI0026657969|nr:NAD(P)/FAD-dependent oxidoreductase [Catalinimonas niigatensis]WPP48773.1 NAD(P)/FAD-dependent oxidoreductase [Catalinimonas niigatensis]
MEKYDIVIIGSGLGGLACGVILSREGYKILVLEKNKQIGGNLQTFARDKCIFDTGIHYIGGLSEGQNLYQYFKYLGIMDDLKLMKLDEYGFDVVTFEGDANEYRHAQGYENFIEVLSAQFPNERQAIKEYCEMIRKVCARFPMYNLLPSNGDWSNIAYHDVSARDFIASCTSNPKLQAVLAGTNLLYAGEGDKTSLYTHALVVNSYIESSWKCIDGGSQIARLLTRLIRQNGGEVLKHAKASRFIFKDEVIEAVELEDGRRFEGKSFISNIHPAITLDMVEEGKIRNVYRKRINNLENSISVFIVYLVMKKNTMDYFNCNYYHYINPDVWGGTTYGKDWPHNYAIFTGASSKGNAYVETLTLMAYMNYAEVRAWEGTYNTSLHQEERGEAYETFKREKAEQLITQMEKRFPGIRQNIASYYTSTPLTYRDYIGTKDGSLYGILKDYKDPLRSFLSARTKIPNLLLTGQNLNMHGVLGVTIGAVVTCSEFLGNEYLMKKVRQA